MASTSKPSTLIFYIIDLLSYCHPINFCKTLLAKGRLHFCFQHSLKQRDFGSKAPDCLKPFSWEICTCWWIESLKSKFLILIQKVLTCNRKFKARLASNVADCTLSRVLFMAHLKSDVERTRSAQRTTTTSHLDLSHPSLTRMGSTMPANLHRRSMFNNCMY